MGVLLHNVDDAIDVVETLPMLIGAHFSGIHDFPVKGYDNLIRKVAIIECIQIHEANARKRLVSEGNKILLRLASN